MKIPFSNSNYKKKTLGNGFRICLVKSVIFFACLYVQLYQVIWACLDCKHDKFDKRRYGKKKNTNIHFCSKESAWLVWKKNKNSHAIKAKQPCNKTFLHMYTSTLWLGISPINKIWRISGFFSLFKCQLLLVLVFVE